MDSNNATSVNEFSTDKLPDLGTFTIGHTDNENQKFNFEPG